jgi:hypothetical protein
MSKLTELLSTLEESRQVRRNLHQYQQSIAKTYVFLRDIENKDFAFLLINDDE